MRAFKEALGPARSGGTKGRRSARILRTERLTAYLISVGKLSNTRTTLIATVTIISIGNIGF
jgi:hypothetical protein